jgi:dihydroxy-acid dehydratase
VYPKTSGLRCALSSSAPAPYRTARSTASDQARGDLIAKNIRARDVVTPEVAGNAARVVNYTGRSTNANLHLRRSRTRRDRFQPFDVIIFRDTPWLRGSETGQSARVAKPVRGRRRSVSDEGNCSAQTGTTIA